MNVRWPSNLSVGDRVACAVAALAFLGALLELAWPHSMHATSTDDATANDVSVPELAAPVRPTPDTAVIVSRPLFTVNRLPYEVPVLDPLGGPGGNRRDAEPEVSFELRAVIRTSSTNIALLTVAGQNTPTRLRPGEQISGWTLREVDDESVRLERDGREMRVVLLSKNKNGQEG